MNEKQILGNAINALPFVVITVACGIDLGFQTVALCWLAVGAIYLCFFVGDKLSNS
jgi:hypothetical protein